jgi:hypothetical protein
MNYKKIYNQIVKRAKYRNLNGYSETHHIIPKCMGGTDLDTNLVKLTAKEHYVVHKLLVEIYPNERKLKYAVRFMSLLSNHLDRKYIVGSREYSRLKSIHTHSEETKKKIGDSHKGRTYPNGERNGRGLGRVIGPMSEEHRKKLGDSKRGRIQNKLECPHCGKIGGDAAMSRWHFDNCKNKTK